VFVDPDVSLIAEMTHQITACLLPLYRDDLKNEATTLAELALPAEFSLEQLWQLADLVSSITRLIDRGAWM